MKEVLYDWYGYNHIILKYLNSMFTYEPIAASVGLLAKIANPYIFPYCFLALMITAICHYAIVKTDKDLIFIKWTNCLTSFFLANISLWACVNLLKDIFSFSRPFCSDDIDNVAYSSQMIESTHCYRSFPSGHTSFTMMLVIVFWPYLGALGRSICITFYILTSLSRSVGGFHFPADLLWGSIISYAICYAVTKATNKAIRYNKNILVYIKDKIIETISKAPKQTEL